MSLMSMALLMLVHTFTSDCSANCAPSDGW